MTATIRYVAQEIIDTLFALAKVAQAEGASELFIGHPHANRYRFNVAGASYEGSVDPRLLTQLSRVLLRQRRATLRGKGGDCPALTLGVMDLTAPVVFVEWRRTVSTTRSGPSVAPSRGRERRILVLEDEPEIAALISKRLERSGLTVISCASTAEARRVLAEHGEKIDLLLSDLHLPESDSHGFFQEIRASGHRLPIIVLTSECDPAAMREVIECGIDAYLWKGSEPELLLAWIRNLTNPERARRFNL